jgi:hypothetical protein
MASYFWRFLGDCFCLRSRRAFYLERPDPRCCFMAHHAGGGFSFFRLGNVWEKNYDENCHGNTDPAFSLWRYCWLDGCIEPFLKLHFFYVCLCIGAKEKIVPDKQQ